MGNFFYHSIESFLKDTTSSDELGISCPPDVAGFFTRQGYKKSEQIPFIDVKENKILSKVNDFFGMAKDSMKRDK